MRKVITISAAGYFIEWYDYGIYGVLAGTIAVVLVPPGEGGAANLLLVYGLFALTFLIRPLGGVLLGSLADRIGRKPTMIVALTMMSIGTAGIGFLPPYAMIGIAAPILLLALRFLQGFSTGGEVVSAMSYTGEHARVGRRAFSMACLQSQSFLGLLAGSAVAAWLTSTQTPETMLSWGWRIPFLIAIPLGFIAFLIRRHAHESPDFEELRQAGVVAKQPLKEVISSPRHLRAAATAGFLALLNGSGYYVLFVYSPVFLTGQGHFSPTDALVITSCALVVIATCVPLAGLLSDRLGRRPVLIGSAVLMGLLAVPCYMMTQGGDVGQAIIGMSLLAIAFSGHTGVLHTTLLEMFPTRVRGTAYALGYNVSTAIFGGAAPLVMTALIGATKDPLIPAYYTIVTAIGTAITAWIIRETYKSSLHDDPKSVKKASAAS